MIRIVQCWDDGNIEDIRLCEILRSAGARASFNLNAGLHGPQSNFSHRHNNERDVFRLAKSELIETYAGFTIANHSLTHPWADRIPLEKWRADVNDGRKQLQDLFGQEITGFAYPYGVKDERIAGIVREAGHVYARTCDNATPCFPPADPMLFPSDCHHAAPDFWQRYENAKAAGATVFYFWGHSYEFANEDDWQVFQNKLARFNSDPDAVWADLPDLFH
jgi:peptidoglycan/xylan/chitin deacetylase (PgdA/CDA1 family)